MKCTQCGHGPVAAYECGYCGAKACSRCVTECETSGGFEVACNACLKLAKSERTGARYAEIKRTPIEDSRRSGEQLAAVDERMINEVPEEPYDGEEELLAIEGPLKREELCSVCECRLARVECGCCEKAIGTCGAACLLRHSEGRYEIPKPCLLYTSPSPRDATLSRMPSSA